MTTLSPKAFSNLLSGLTKRLYFGEAAKYSNAVLLESLFNIAPADQAERGDLVAEIESIAALLITAGKENYDEARMEEALAASRSSLVSAEQAKVLLAFWLHEREKVHEAMVKKATWNARFENIAWRVDVKAVSKTSADLNEPVAFFELSTSKGGGGGGSSSSSRSQQKARFEMNREEVGDLLKSLDDIQRHIDEASR